MADTGILTTTVMNMTYVVLKPELSESLVTTVSPCAGITNFKVHRFNVRFHHNLLSEALVTLLAFESSNFLMDSLYVPLESLRLAKL